MIVAKYRIKFIFLLQRQIPASEKEKKLFLSIFFSARLIFVGPRERPSAAFTSSEAAARGKTKAKVEMGENEKKAGERKREIE